jgi:hypothetical protein
MRLLPALAASAALLVGACQNPDGSVNLPATLALGAGVAIAGVALASASSDHRPSYQRHAGYDRRPSYGYGYGHGRPAHGGHYRRW